MNEKDIGLPEPEKTEQEQIPQTLREIAKKLGFTETAELQEIERQAIEASLILNTPFRSPEAEEKFKNLIAQIQTLGEPIAEQEIPKTGLSQIGLILTRAATLFESNQFEDCLKDTIDALEQLRYGITYHNIAASHPEVPLVAEKLEEIKRRLDQMLGKVKEGKPESKRAQIAEQNLQELTRRREAGELEPTDYEVNYIYYLQQMDRPVTRKEVGNRAIVIRPEEFEGLGYLEIVLPTGEKIVLDFTEETFDKRSSLIIFPEELGEKNIEQEKQEPTSQELAKVCSEVLSEEDCAEIAGMPFDEALGYVFTLLIENGIEDPETYLKKGGILE